MDKGFKQISPCENWFYVAEDIHKKPIVFKISAWAITAEDEVIGLISATNAATEKGVAKLICPPPIKGHYLPFDALSEEQLQQYRKG